MANQNFNTFGRGGVIADQATYDAGLRAHMIKVYNYMASGLALSGIVAFALFKVPSLAVMDCVPAVFSVALKVWTPASPVVNV